MSLAIQKLEKAHGGVLMPRLLTKMLLRVISVLPSSGTDHSIIEFDEDVEETMIPRDVKEGHFSVIADKAGKQKRFVLELRYLRNPEFLELLEQAGEEYGFRQEGVLVLPCHPEELQKIVEDSTKINR